MLTNTQRAAKNFDKSYSSYSKKAARAEREARSLRILDLMNPAPKQTKPSVPLGSLRKG